MSFNATESAFEGFRLARRAPVAILAWSLAYAAFFVVFFVVGGRSLIHILTLIEQMKASEPSMAELSELGRAYGLLGLWVMPLSLLFGAVLNTAIARSVIAPGDRRFGYLRLGRDELRVLVVNIAISLIFMAVTLVGMGVAMGLAGAAGAMSLPVLVLPAVLIALAAVGFGVWLAVRLSLAVPITFAEKRIAIFDSFAVTKGRFWPLLGMAVLAGVMTMLVSLLGSMVAAPLNLMFGGLERLTTGGASDLQALLVAAWPALLVWTVVNAVLSAAQAGILYAPFASAYQAFKGAPRG
jgi:hypothetical protein